MNRREFESELVSIIVTNNLDLHSALPCDPGPRAKIKSRKYLGPDYSTREKIKEKGWSMVQSGVEHLKLVGFGLIAYSHFYRSQERAQNSNRNHPSFSEFITHWFYSDPGFFDKEARSKLMRLYAKPDKLKIKPGKSYWGLAA